MADVIARPSGALLASEPTGDPVSGSCPFAARAGKGLGTEEHWQPYDSSVAFDLLSLAAQCPEPGVRAHRAANAIANFGFKRGTRIIDLLVSL